LTLALALSISGMAFGACGGEEKTRQTSTQEGSVERRPDASIAADERARRPRVVILGDSVTAGLGLPPQAAFPTLIQERVDANGWPFEVVNAGVSGDTSAAGLRRLEWSLEGDVRVLVVALGGNDGLRGIPVAELQRNLSAIISAAQKKGVTVVLAGMEAPPNLGSEYAKAFRDLYTALAREFSVPLVPFLLEGVAGVAAMNQPDGIHPTADGARLVAENVWKVLEPVLRSQTQAR
jgi:acyl-CoA thioesterase-1